MYTVLWRLIEVYLPAIINVDAQLNCLTMGIAGTYYCSVRSCFKILLEFKLIPSRLEKKSIFNQKLRKTKSNLRKPACKY